MVSFGQTLADNNDSVGDISDNDPGDRLLASISGAANVSLSDSYESHPLYNKLKSALSKHQGLSIACINVRSLLPKIDEIRLILTLCSIDVLCICESWLDDSIYDNDIACDGYNIVREDRNR